MSTHDTDTKEQEGNSTTSSQLDAQEINRCLKIHKIRTSYITLKPAEIKVKNFKACRI